MFWPYVLPLVVICSISMLGSRQMIRTSAAIFANWAINTAFVMLTGIYDPWLFFMLTDGLTAWVILYPPAGRVQAALAWTYIGQIILHVVYSVSDHSLVEFAYWQALTLVAFVQLLLLGGWTIAHWGRLMGWGEKGEGRWG